MKCNSIYLFIGCNYSFIPLKWWLAEYFSQLQYYLHPFRCCWQCVATCWSWFSCASSRGSFCRVMSGSSKGAHCSPLLLQILGC